MRVVAVKQTEMLLWLSQRRTLWQLARTASPVALQNLWTKQMSVEEMRHFVCQTMMTLANTLEKATNDKAHALAMRSFTEELAKRLGVLKD